MAHIVTLLSLILLIPTTLAQDPAYCTTSWTSVYAPTYVLPFSTTPTVIPPLPCPGAYAVQEGTCCNDTAYSCANGFCTCPNGTVIYSAPLAPCATINPFYSGCPGNMLDGLCCSGPGIFQNGPYSASADQLTPVCTMGTALCTVTTQNDGLVSTRTLPPSISYTDSVCGTCPLYTRTSTASVQNIAVETRRTVGRRAINVAAAGAAIVFWNYRFQYSCTSKSALVLEVTPLGISVVSETMCSHFTVLKQERQTTIAIVADKHCAWTAAPATLDPIVLIAK